MVFIYKNWVKSGTAQSVSDVISQKADVTLVELLNPRDTAPHEIENMEKAAQMLLDACCGQDEIHIFGDYDADGITSTAILFLLLKRLGKMPHIRLPRRMSEGYGISTGAVDEMKSGLLITVDNGVVAFDAIQKAKDKGLKVIVLDHHQPSPDGKLPTADVVVDALVHPDKNAFLHFCGAGLSYKLAQYVLHPTQDVVLLKKLNALAAIGTIADQMPIIGANRIIINNGIKAINDGFITQGLRSLLDASGLAYVDKDNIAFKLGPILNAAGRIEDDGARVSCGCIAQDEKPMDKVAAGLVALNDKRKEMTADACVIANGQTIGNLTAPIIVRLPQIYEGICGIVAGKLADQYNMPAIVFSPVLGDNGAAMLRGSARSANGVNIKSILDTIAGKVEMKYGGHAGAAGITITKDQLSAFKTAMQQELSDYSAKAEDTYVYDLEITESQAGSVLNELAKYEPFGEGNPEPTFLIKNIYAVNDKRTGELYRTMGKDGEHLRIRSHNSSLVWFGHAEDYKHMGAPAAMCAVGKLNMNHGPYGDSPQILADDIRRE